MGIMEHRFGGPWTQKKLSILENYLSIYTTALSNHFTLHYVDGFAGTGSQNTKINDSQRVLVPEENLRGSAKVALEINPSFHQFHFNDLNPKHAQALEEIKRGFPDKQVHITQKDANTFVPDFCNTLRWNDRAVLLLDPFSTELDWNTLKPVAQSEKIDLWLLFPISAILRMTPKDGAKIIPEWGKTLSRLLGTEDWQKALYKPKPTPLIQDMFENQEEDAATRLNIDELELWITNRLKELFSYVAKPVPLKNNKTTLFLFYFAVSNKKDVAWKLADRIVKNILQNQN